MPKRSKNSAAKGFYHEINLSAVLENLLGFYQKNDSKGLQRYVHKFKAGLVSGGVGDGKQVLHNIFVILLNQFVSSQDKLKKEQLLWVATSLKKEIDPNWRTRGGKSGLTFLQLVFEQGAKEFVALCLESGNTHIDFSWDIEIASGQIYKLTAVQAIFFASFTPEDSLQILNQLLAYKPKLTAEIFLNICGSCSSINIKLIERLIEYGADIFYLSEKNNDNCLIKAMNELQLIKENADANPKDLNERAEQVKAAEECVIVFLNCLLVAMEKQTKTSQGKDLIEKIKLGERIKNIALLQAIYIENIKVVELLLKAGADPCFISYDSHKNKFPENALLKAVGNNQFRIFNLILTVMNEKATKDNKEVLQLIKNMALCIAIRTHLSGIVYILLINGADPNYRDEYCHIPLNEVVCSLDSKNKYVPKAMTQNPGRYSEKQIEENAYHILSLLLKQGACINPAVNKVIFSPLASAVCIGNKRLVSFLLDNGSDPDLLTADKDSVVKLAALEGHQELLPIILPRIKSRENLYVLNDRGYSALSAIIWECDKEMIQYCFNTLKLDIHTPIFLHKKQLLSPLAVAAICRKELDIVKCLVDLGANIKQIIASQDGSNPMTVLKYSLKPDIFTFLYSRYLCANTDIQMLDDAVLQVASYFAQFNPHVEQNGLLGFELFDLAFVNAEQRVGSIYLEQEEILNLIKTISLNKKFELDKYFQEFVKENLDDRSKYLPQSKDMTLSLQAEIIHKRTAEQHKKIYEILIKTDVLLDEMVSSLKEIETCSLSSKQKYSNAKIQMDLLKEKSQAFKKILDENYNGSSELYQINFSLFEKVSKCLKNITEDAVDAIKVTYDVIFKLVDKSLLLEKMSKDVLVIEEQTDLKLKEILQLKNRIMRHEESLAKKNLEKRLKEDAEKDRDAQLNNEEAKEKKEALERQIRIEQAIQARKVTWLAEQEKHKAHRMIEVRKAGAEQDCVVNEMAAQYMQTKKSRNKIRYMPIPFCQAFSRRLASSIVGKIQRRKRFIRYCDSFS